MQARVISNSVAGISDFRINLSGPWRQETGLRMLMMFGSMYQFLNQAKKTKIFSGNVHSLVFH